MQHTVFMPFIAGSRVVNQILQLVPDVNSFRMTLRCIKMWSKGKLYASVCLSGLCMLTGLLSARGIYGNAQGYLGGIAWAILVARICQLYPNCCPSMLVLRFFRVLSQWKWPAAVVLKAVEEGNMGLRVWNPKVCRACHHSNVHHSPPCVCRFMLVMALI